MSHSPTLSRPKLLAGELRLENAGRERAGELRREEIVSNHNRAM